MNRSYFKDKQKIARSFSRAARSYDSVAQLQRDVADTLLAMVSNYSGHIADLGCGTGYCSQQLLLEYGENIHHITALDLAEGMALFARQKTQNICGGVDQINWLCADIEHLPLAKQSLDFVISSLSIQWSDRLVDVFTRVYDALKPGARFLFSTLGPGTLCELNCAWQKADKQYVHVNKFVDSEHIMNALEQSGFSLQDYQQQTRVLHYSHALELMKELKALGAHNVNQGIKPGLTGRQTLRDLSKAYDVFRDDAGKLPASYQVYYFCLMRTD